MPAPYDDELELVAGAMGHAGWTWPFQFGIPLLNDVIDALFPRPVTNVLLPWTIPIRDKWDEFVGWVKGWFADNADGETVTQEEFEAMLITACEYAADQMGFDLWDTAEGLPSMPEYTPTGGGGN